MYKIATDPLSKTTSVSKIEGDTIIFFTEDSSLWEEYLTWLSKGNTAEEWSADAD